MDRRTTGNSPDTAMGPGASAAILVVDDDETLRGLLQRMLGRAGYEVELASNGREALEILTLREFDVVILDILMPEMDGFKTCEEIRRRWDVPIVMLTALNRPDEIVRGFHLGADDYITKPFTLREVEVRIHAILRRMSWNRARQEQALVALRDVVVNNEQHSVTVRGSLVQLTPIEYELLLCLMNSADRPVSKDELFKKVWGYSIAGGTNLVEVAMRRLREKVEENPSSPTYLVTVRGVGYAFRTQGLSDRYGVDA